MPLVSLSPLEGMEGISVSFSAIFKRIKRENGIPVMQTDARGREQPVLEDVECAWQLIYDRLKGFDKLDLIMEIQPPKDWSVSRDGGPRRIVREDLRLIDEE